MVEDTVLFNKKISISLVVASMVTCGNIKFTGLLYGGIFCIAYFLWDCYKNIKNIVGSNLINKYEISFFENERKNYKFEYQTMSITTMLSKGVDGYEFDTELKIFESRMFKFYKKEKIENIFDEEKYKVIG